MQNILSAAPKANTVKRIVFTQAGAALVDPGEGDALGIGMEGVIDGTLYALNFSIGLREQGCLLMMIMMMILMSGFVVEYVEVNPHTASLRPLLASPHHAYSAAKAYCMTYLRELQEKNELPFSIVQVIPGTVIGPSELVGSAEEAYAKMDRMSKALLFDDVRPRYAFGFVHVEDCARVHVEALDEVKVKDGEIPAWFIAAGSTPVGISAGAIWKEVGDMVEEEFGEQVARGVFKVGRDKLPTNMPYRVDSKRTQNMLLDGQDFKSLSDCVREVAEWYNSLLEKEKEKIEGD